MVEFAPDEWKKVVIHEVNEFSLDELLKLRALGVPAGGIGRALLWANGVAFEHNNMPPTKEIIEQQLEGTVHWSSLQFASMPEYQDTIMVGNITVQVGNVSANKLFHELADWLKKTYKET